jgi:hypothetical protein
MSFSDGNLSVSDLENKPEGKQMSKQRLFPQQNIKLPSSKEETKLN